MAKALTQQAFMESLVEQLYERDTELYQQYLVGHVSAEEDPITDTLFPISDAPRDTPEWQPKPPKYKLEELQKEVDELEKQMGYEKMLVKVGQVVIKLGISAIAKGAI